MDDLLKVARRNWETLSLKWQSGVERHHREADFGGCLDAKRDLPRRYDRSPTKEHLISKAAKRRPRIGTDDPRIAHAIFTLRETAAYLDVPKSTVQWWARPPQGRGSLLTCFPNQGREATVPFIGFAEAFVLTSFRRAGVPMQRIRPAVEVLTREIGVEHALASKRLYTDGAEVLFDYANRKGEAKVADLVVLRTKQHQFTEVVSDYLQRIEYGGDGWADRVRLPVYGQAEVIVDPRVAFGLPMVVNGGARVEDLVDRFRAGDSVGNIAADFNVPPSEVEDVIRVATKAAA
ncbi:MAG TPA: DUF433 domain-containing protein [Solirubrobacterales bacterium]